MLTTHGASDPEIPVAGGPSRVLREGIAYAPLDDVVARWRRLDGCGSAPSVAASATSTSRTWRCAGGSEVRVIVVAGGGHPWPGAALVNAPWSPAAAFDSAGTIASFFAAHPRAVV